MKNEGWTLSDLAGELWARGIDIDDISNEELFRVLDKRTPEEASREIDEIDNL